MKKIRVLWTEAIRLEDVNLSRYAEDCGIYSINVIDDDYSERSIYIGKTTGTFSKRMYQHTHRTEGSGAFMEYKGVKYVRFAIIPRSFKCTDKQYERLLSHVEFDAISRTHPKYNISPGISIKEYRMIPVENILISNAVHELFNL